MVGFSELVLSVGTLLVVLIGLGLIFARLYKRASKEVAFVRTGLGGQKVVKDGGALVLPVFQELIRVGMNTLRLEVRRANESALITKDRMRVDVTAEFYLRVRPDEEAIAAAAQTLGQRTLEPGLLKELVEGKFVDALRAVAALMAMEELHEQRVEFVKRVQQAVSEDLSKNGLELESVSLTGLNQTDMAYFNPNNAFDAEGLTRLTEEIQARKKIRNDIERDTAVEIERKNLETQMQSLNIKRDEEYAKLAQQQEIEIRKAATEAQIQSEQAVRKREAERARIEAARDVKLAQIEAERESKEKDIAREKAVQIAGQDKAIAISAKSEEESLAAARADVQRAEAARAEENVITVRKIAEADRAKQVVLVAAREEAEKQAIRVTVAAEAEKQAATDRAEALRIAAQGEADAVRLKADADERRYTVEAEGQRQINEARNALSPDQVRLELQLELIRKLPGIIEQQVKPMQAIDALKIIDVRGLGGGGGSAGGGAGSGNLADDLVAAALKYRAQAPILDQLMAELGLDQAIAQGTALKSSTLTGEPEADTRIPGPAAKPPAKGG